MIYIFCRIFFFVVNHCFFSIICLPVQVSTAVTTTIGRAANIITGNEGGREGRLKIQGQSIFYAARSFRVTAAEEYRGINDDNKRRRIDRKADFWRRVGGVDYSLTVGHERGLFIYRLQQKKKIKKPISNDRKIIGVECVEFLRSGRCVLCTVNMQTVFFFFRALDSVAALHVKQCAHWTVREIKPYSVFPSRTQRSGGRINPVTEWRVSHKRRSARRITRKRRHTPNASRANASTRYDTQFIVHTY